MLNAIIPPKYSIMLLKSYRIMKIDRIFVTIILNYGCAFKNYIKSMNIYVIPIIRARNIVVSST